MSLFVLPENQRLLWNAIQKIPVFQQYPEEQKEPWFSAKIEQFYQKIPVFYKTTMSIPDLQRFNREVILFMINDLPKISPSHFSIETPANMYNGIVTQDHISNSNVQTPKNQTREFMIEQKQEEMNRQFSVRQMEYSSMLKSNVPKEIDFRIPQELDKPLENIDELIRMHQKDRELDLTLLPSITVNEPNNTKRLIVHNEDAEIMVDLESESNIKKVHWE